MLFIITTAQFRKSLKKLSKSGSFNMVKIEKVIQVIAEGKKLKPTEHDHQLTGKLASFRECHVENDLLLIYKVEEDCLTLANIGSHSEMFK